jgi:hypothetical protein
MSDTSRLISNKRPFRRAKADFSSAVCWLLLQYRAVVTRRSLISSLMLLRRSEMLFASIITFDSPVDFKRLGLRMCFSNSLYISTRSEGRARHTSRHPQPALPRYCLLLSQKVRVHESPVPFPLQQFDLKPCWRPTQRAQPCKLAAKLSCIRGQGGPNWLMR